jgi:hypothetical protein
MPFRQQRDSSHTATPLPEKPPPVFHHIDTGALPSSSIRGDARAVREKRTIYPRRRRALDADTHPGTTGVWEVGLIRGQLRAHLRATKHCSEASPGIDHHFSLDILSGGIYL